MENPTETPFTPNLELQAIFSQWASYGKDSKEDCTEPKRDSQPSTREIGIAGPSTSATTSKIAKSRQKYFDLPRRDFLHRVAKNEAKQRLSRIMKKNNVNILYIGGIGAKITRKIRKKPAKKAKKVRKSKPVKKPRRKLTRIQTSGSYCSSCDGYY